jgi:type I restriction enzyme, S subunit
MSWPQTPFETLYAVPSRNGIYKPKEFHGTGCRMVNMGELFGFDFISDQDMERVELNDAEQSISALEDGDLLFGRRSLVEAGAGKCSLVVEPPDILTFESSIIRVRLDKHRVNPRFFYYYFRSPQGRGLVRSIVSGTNVKGIRGSELKKLPVATPPKTTQDNIASILSLYDALIDNNQRRTTILQNAARLLYQEWFVHLRFPGHEHTPITQPIPKGWEQVPFEDALVLQRGFDLPHSEWQEGEFPICGSTGVIGFHSESKVKGPGVFTGRSGSLGVVNYVEEDHWPHNTALWVREFKKVSPLFALFLLRELKLERYNGGASVPTLDRKAVHRLPVLIPPPKLITYFDEQLAPVFAQLRNLRQQDHKLRAARDLLLPRLMSGKIAV